MFFHWCSFKNSLSNELVCNSHTIMLTICKLEYILKEIAMLTICKLEYVLKEIALEFLFCFEDLLWI